MWCSVDIFCRPNCHAATRFMFKVFHTGIVLYCCIYAALTAFFRVTWKEYLVYTPFVYQTTKHHLFYILKWLRLEIVGIFLVFVFLSAENSARTKLSALLSLDNNCIFAHAKSLKEAGDSCFLECCNVIHASSTIIAV